MKTIFLAFLLCLTFWLPVFSQKTEEIDEFGSLVNCEEYLARMDSVIQNAQKNPSVTIYVLVYEGKQANYDYKSNKTKFSLPPVGLAKAKIASMKKYISGFRNFSLERFVFVNAGLREEFGVEFWSVPQGSTPPKPAPELKKIRYRKGKAYGFCLGCCG